MTTRAMTGSCLVVGIGDPARGDDGVGLAVARAVADRALPGVYVCVHRDPTALMDLWAGRDLVVVVDAVRSGAVPGTVHRLAVGVGETPLPFPAWAASGRGTHAFGLAAVVELARALGRLPEHLVVVGVEAASFGCGYPLSTEVLAAVPVAAEQVVEEVRAHVRR
ncbi:hydrogenase maturation protease [Nocardioides sp.]|uniref:hydrogenase maturation protease n=1 Tax=Nocardioides sp. TaxID=35761 RepID=UPI0025F262B2|nr:hydrogenase maturation protease [Nocardioides sp.]